MAENTSPSVRKSKGLSCTLEVGGRQFLKGETRDLSERQATVQIPALAIPENKIKQGTKCMLKLVVRSPNGQMEGINIPCNASYIVVTTVGLNLHTDGLDNKQRELFQSILTKK